MKIYKIILAFIISITFGFGVTLDLRVNEITGLVGNEVELAIVTENGFSNVAMMELELLFDDTKMTFLNSESSLLSSANINASNGVLKIVWIYTSNMMALASGDTLAKLSFDVLPSNNQTGDYLTLSFTDKCMASDKDENLFDMTLVNGGIHVTENTIFFSIPRVVKYDNTSVSVPVIVNYGFDNVAMVELHIAFDQTKLTYNSITSSYINAENVNLIGNVLTILWVYEGTSMNIADNQDLLSINFTANMPEGSESFASVRFVGENNVSDADAYPFMLLFKDGGVLNFDTSSMLITIPSVTGYDNKPVTVPMVVDYSVTNVGSIQLYVNYDDENMDYSGMESAYLSSSNVTRNGNTITISWSSGTGINFSDNDTLVKFNFNVDLTSDVVNFVPVTFTGENSVSDASGNPFQLYLDDGGVNIEEWVSGLDQDIIIREFKLYQNYPNPFNPTTTISFDLAESATINLSIYNLSGELLQTLVNSRLDNGHHRIKWQAGNFSSGIYIYRLQSDGFHETQKCILMK
ncbi:MAG: T9SS type A sorting domain-containing protein [Candidatus Marinimicrobia bacterium]|nr:T9SS type A sorting domain-containing protein [Candidatus Neomarinimicrobiota bacterium]